jgi:charged multivesicular body protein 6
MLALKKRRYQLQLLKKTETQLESVLELVNGLEFAKVQQRVVEGLRGGTRVLRELHREMDLEQVGRLMDDTRDAIAYQEASSQPCSRLEGR